MLNYIVPTRYLLFTIFIISYIASILRNTPTRSHRIETTVHNFAKANLRNRIYVIRSTVHMARHKHNGTFNGLRLSPVYMYMCLSVFVCVYCFFCLSSS